MCIRDRVSTQSTWEQQPKSQQEQHEATRLTSVQMSKISKILCLLALISVIHGLVFPGYDLHDPRWANSAMCHIRRYVPWSGDWEDYDVPLARQSSTQGSRLINFANLFAALGLPCGGQGLCTPPDIIAVNYANAHNNLECQADLSSLGIRGTTVRTAEDAVKAFKAGKVVMVAYRETTAKSDSRRLLIVTGLTESSFLVYDPVLKEMPFTRLDYWADVYDNFVVPSQQDKFLAQNLSAFTSNSLKVLILMCVNVIKQPKSGHQTIKCYKLSFSILYLSPIPIQILSLIHI
eukprot:TRINITY_DN6613_c0_g1_i9.p1 TRINITY_DN6613_c0_g1~~TRINITY_DN6613_c0_g1_i9.p1  ORF type:complete len:291 (+),score=30.66 TRINITY_DN6613_c0_g1_i9:65-937(+)